MARKPLIAPGSVLPDSDTLTRIIANDREKSGRAAPEQILTQVSKDASKEISMHSLAESEAPPKRSAAKSLGKADREPVVRLSIDVPQSMYDRIKKYVLDQRIESTRALTLALYQDFLEDEGY